MKTTNLLALLASFCIVAACGERTAEPEQPAPAMDAPVADADTGMPAMPPGSSMKLPATTSSDSARTHYQQGWDAFDMFRLNDANMHFMQAIAADPPFAMAHLMAAMTANSTEEFAKHLGHAVDRATGASRGEQLMIEAIQKGFAGDQQGQLASLIELTQLHPDSPRALQFLATTQTNQNDIDGARATLARAIELDPHLATVHMQAGNNYLFQEPKDFATAESHFQMAVDLAPDEPNPHDLLGDVHRAQGKLQAAYDDYTKAAELAPEMGSPLQQRGHVNSFLGNYDEARADYTRSAELEDARGTNFGPGFLMYRAFVNLYEGDPDAAITELRELAAGIDATEMKGGSDLKINALTSAAQIATHYGNADVASELIGEVAELMRQQADVVGTEQFRHAQEANIAYLEGMLAARMGDTEAASAKAAEFREHVAGNTNPRKLERMHEIMGMRDFYQDEFATAAGHLAQGDVVNNEYIKYYLALSNQAAGNEEEADKLFDELAVWNFNDVAYAMTRGDILVRASGE